MRTAVVTGASGGIGSEIARRLAADGFAVVAGYNSGAERAERLVAELAGDGHAAVRVSVLEPDSLAGLADHIASTSGRVDVLVNCAGVTRPVPHADLDALDDELIEQIFATNWRGPFATIRALRSLLESADGSVVVNISSVSAVTGDGSNVAYCASKAALDSMTRSLARALAPRVRVVSVAPGWVPGHYADRMPPGGPRLAAQRNPAAAAGHAPRRRRGGERRGQPSAVHDRRSDRRRRGPPPRRFLTRADA